MSELEIHFNTLLEMALKSKNEALQIYEENQTESMRIYLEKVQFIYDELNSMKSGVNHKNALDGDFLYYAQKVLIENTLH